MRISWMPFRRCRPPLSAAVLFVLFAAYEATATVGARSEEPPVFAITNARIIPVSGPAIESGTVVVRNGIIESVGAVISIPDDARVIDAKGMILYPGLIDAMSDVGIEEARPQQPSATRAAGESPSAPPATQAQTSLAADERQGLTPYLQAADIWNPASKRIETARAAGVTTALIAPRKGFFQGQSALVNLAGTSVGRTVVKAPVFLHISLTSPGGFGAGYPSSLMGILAFIKQTLLDAQEYEFAWNVYGSNPGVARPEYSRALQALQPALKRQMAVVLPGDTPAQIQRSLDLAAAFKLRMILAGGMEADKMGPILKGLDVPVLLTAKFPERDRDSDPEVEEELAVLRRRVEAPSHTAALANSGVRFAFRSDDMADPRDFLRNIGRAVEAGLDKSAALRALTLTPAEIFGVADKLGSIEKGKCANLILATGDIFDSHTRIKLVVIDGQRFEIPASETASPGQSQGDSSTSLSGTWTLRINSPQGPLEVTLRVQQLGTSLSGALSSPFGTADISEGSVSGNNITFKANLNPSGSGSFIVIFSATIQGSTMSGSADAGIMGRMEFAGSKSAIDR